MGLRVPMRKPSMGGETSVLSKRLLKLGAFPETSLYRGMRGVITGSSECRLDYGRVPLDLRPEPSPLAPHQHGLDGDHAHCWWHGLEEEVHHDLAGLQHGVSVHSDAQLLHCSMLHENKIVLAAKPPFRGAARLGFHVA